mmetsp:Transcript_30160/g.51836  ORF Transcript_30160/g.51836 Transcript_30160/m.51836 type:complete len:86 (+) Transcript_30160:162-419(+)
MLPCVSSQCKIVALSNRTPSGERTGSVTKWWLMAHWNVSAVSPLESTCLDLDLDFDFDFDLGAGPLLGAAPLELSDGGSHVLEVV